MVALGGEGVLRDKLREANVPTRSVQEMWRDIDIAKDISSFIKLFKIIKEENPDVLHVHSPKAAGLGALAGRMLGVKKIIYTVHGFAFHENRPFYQKAMIAFISWITMLLSTDVITLYEKALRETKHFPYITDKLHLIHPGIAVPTFFATSSARQLLQQRTSLPFEKKILIGTIAELHTNKGLGYALEAFQKLASHSPSFIFFIIGEGEERGQLEAMIKEKDLQNNVVLAGQIPLAAEYLKAFSIFILPSIKEALPYALLEAGVAGLPVIATTVGGVPEIVEDMKSGVLIQPKKSDEIYYAIEFLLNHKNTQREYAQNLQEKVKRDFNLGNMLTATFKLY